ncbi:DUF192 domain-containing protein [Bacteroidetes bacterium endosymbiont of Geopemphigus sp.]|uniref:DUF192 domain-containing protein n=1 Tax=Bacteroidetes bacterium endosymbiont of Geopemphigus sp. TaxID=2047937 RepID=UPI000CD0DC3F|nr:DUF192 domain-containing protein [Bacteroidetes bacterium endosymbiont of Geopemphigus sp.]
MKRIFFNVLLVGLIFMACESKSTSDVSTTKEDQNIEIEFIKQGELWLKNGDKVLKKLDIELATTEIQHSQGLMYRSFMNENRGMLFIFEQSEQRSFWMKNTRIPLDIIYIKEDGTVLNIAKNATAFTEIGIDSSKGPTKFVLEVNAGMADKWRVKEGETKAYFEKIAQ